MRAPGIPGVWGLGKALGWCSQSLLARLEVGAPQSHAREGCCGYAKEEHRQLLTLQVVYWMIPLVVRCSGWRLGLSRWHSSLCVGNSASADGKPQKGSCSQTWKNAFFRGFSSIHSSEMEKLRHRRVVICRG